MIRLGLRLTLGGGREALVRLLATAFAVTLGVGLLLTTLAGINAVHAQNDRYAWLESGSVQARTPPGGPAGGTSVTPSVATSTQPLLWRVAPDYFHGQLIGRVDVAATGPDSPLPPGISHLPGPGQYYASPALARLLHATPTDQLGSRYGTDNLGTIGDTALPSPDSLLVIVGHSASDLEKSEDVQAITAIATTAPDQCSDCAIGVGINANGLVLILSVITLALFFPILIFVATAARRT
ncbi:MAG: ABC transporter permease, partial [Actinobacteria bacterium]|nr:ABC transporter permease [Actinomycetota bacterium]